MAADLMEKTLRYKGMLNEAIADVQIVATSDARLDRIAEEYLTMAKSYYADGVHFLATGDPVNALVCFSYGHAWLDAGVRLGVFRTTKKELFAA
jgi:uncharacterized protein